jgi:hypothetical protein
MADGYTNMTHLIDMTFAEALRVHSAAACYFSHASPPHQKTSD